MFHLIERDWEFEVSHTSVVRGLLANVGFWENELEASPFVTGMIKNGYSLPLAAKIPSFYAKNNASSLRQAEFVEKSIFEFLKQGCIEELTCMPYCCNPLTVAESGKLRLVIDLRHVNEFLDFPKFKYKDLRIARQHLGEDYFFTTFDLKSGYHISIRDEDKQYLGFAWTFANWKTRYFQFAVLPFGLASACYAFTKLTKPLVKKWRKQAKRCTMYLDDGIQAAKSFELAQYHAEVMKCDLKKAGLTINENEKIKFLSIPSRLLARIRD